MRLSPILTAAMVSISCLMPAQANSGILVNGLLSGSAAPMAPKVNAPTACSAAAVTKSDLAARVSRAAIESSALQQISFAEYYVDWSQWMNQVAGSWTQTFNADTRTRKLHCLTEAIVEFTCRADGSISAVELYQGSGDSLCDKLQIESLINCGKLPAFPTGSKRSSVTFLYVWQYKSATASKLRQRVVSKELNREIISTSGQQM
jgi:hypothetical protein